MPVLLLFTRLLKYVNMDEKDIRLWNFLEDSSTEILIVPLLTKLMLIETLWTKSLVWSFFSLVFGVQLWKIFSFY